MVVFVCVVCLFCFYLFVVCVVFVFICFEMVLVDWWFVCCLFCFVCDSVSCSFFGNILNLCNVFLIIEFRMTWWWDIFFSSWHDWDCELGATNYPANPNTNKANVQTNINRQTDKTDRQTNPKQGPFFSLNRFDWDLIEIWLRFDWDLIEIWLIFNWYLIGFDSDLSEIWINLIWFGLDLDCPS